MLLPEFSPSNSNRPTQLLNTGVDVVPSEVSGLILAKVLKCCFLSKVVSVLVCFAWGIRGLFEFMLRMCTGRRAHLEQFQR
ncbi:hypothetical protein A2U01_0010020, partial [Trifolium medium]|nr:hypothetical protein [Trifolium medium]